MKGKDRKERKGTETKGKERNERAGKERQVDFIVVPNVYLGVI